MKKVLMIDYYGMCDQDGRAVGHAPKVLEEYGELIRDAYEVSVAASPCLIEGIKGEFHDKYTLKYNIYSENEMSLRKRIKDKWFLLSNIREALRIEGYDIFWFYKTDFFLFFFLCFMNIRKRKKQTGFMAQIYQASFGQGALQGILNWFYRKGMQKFDGITYAQKTMAGIHPNMLFFPDYYYDPDKYRRYGKAEKKEKAVCLGTMNAYKQLDQLIEAFGRNGYCLEIKGYFYDKDFCNRLSRKLPENIVLEDTILTEEEYYETLAGAKYTILPYDMGQYQSRTSGVLIESLFLDTTAVAPKQLLFENQIDGMGYDRIEELGDPSFWENPPVMHNSARKRDFDKGEIGRRLQTFIDSLRDSGTE